jgi:serine/threonine protein kinase
VLYHMATLVPPFYTSNILQLAGKICASDYDQTPLKHYSDRIRQIVVECLCIDPIRRPDICSVGQLCTDQLMLYTDRSCTTIQTLEKRLRQQDHQRELDLIKQQSQLQQQANYHQRCLSCSSTKESLVSNSGGIPDVSFDGTDGQQETLKPDTFTAGKSERKGDMFRSVVLFSVGLRNTGHDVERVRLQYCTAASQRFEQTSEWPPSFTTGFLRTVTELH